LVWVEQMLSNSLEQVTEQVTDLMGDGTKRARNLGVVLRTAREERALTLREVAERIRIPAHYLTMLEANDYSSIADELYLLPFVRSYAEFLGLDAGALATRFVRGIQPLERPAEPASDLAEEPAGRRGGWFTTAAVMLFVALALYLVGLK
jgi:cytoskeleton protein RodZ